MSREKDVIVSREPIGGFSAKIAVAATFVEGGNGREFLFVLRSPHVSQGDKWGIPGGKMKLGELPHEAALRELKEETLIEADDAALSHLASLQIRYTDLDFEYHMFHLELPVKPTVILNPTEHQAFKWLSLPQALDLPLILGEIECIHIAFPDLVTPCYRFKGGDVWS